MKDNCVNFISSLGNRRGSIRAWAAIQFTEENFYKIEESACHGSYSNSRFNYSTSRYDTYERVLATSSAMLSKDMEMQEMFWEWASSKTSPWHRLFDNGEIDGIRDDQGLLGWCIYGKAVNLVPFNFIKNFAIVCRSLSEHSPKWALWKSLVKKGVLPSDAMYLISVFSPVGPTDDKDVTKLQYLDVRTGGHWGLTDYFYDYGKTNPSTSHANKLDWKRWNTGDINLLPQPPINGFFCSAQKEYTPFSPPKDIVQTEGGKFAQLQFYPTEGVLDEFYKWKDQESV